MLAATVPLQTLQTAGGIEAGTFKSSVSSNLSHDSFGFLDKTNSATNPLDGRRSARSSSSSSTPRTNLREDKGKKMKTLEMEKSLQSRSSSRGGGGVQSPNRSSSQSPQKHDDENRSYGVHHDKRNAPVQVPSHVKRRGRSSENVNGNHITRYSETAQFHVDVPDQSNPLLLDTNARSNSTTCRSRRMPKGGSELLSMMDIATPQPNTQRNRTRSGGRRNARLVQNLLSTSAPFPRSPSYTDLHPGPLSSSEHSHQSNGSNESKTLSEGSSNQRKDDDNNSCVVVQDERNVMLLASSAASHIERRGRSRDKSLGSRGKMTKSSEMAQAYVDAKDRSMLSMFDCTTRPKTSTSQHRPRDHQSDSNRSFGLRLATPRRSTSKNRISGNGDKSIRLIQDALSKNSSHFPSSSSRRTGLGRRLDYSLSSSMHTPKIQPECNSKNSTSQSLLLGLSSSLHNDSSAIPPSSSSRRHKDWSSSSRHCRHPIAAETAMDDDAAKDSNHLPVKPVVRRGRRSITPTENSRRNDWSKLPSIHSTFTTTNIRRSEQEQSRVGVSDLATNNNNPSTEKPQHKNRRHRVTTPVSTLQQDVNRPDMDDDESSVVIPSDSSTSFAGEYTNN